jgi:predicted DNA-binding protein (MmcQ/YjbR family)
MLNRINLDKYIFDTYGVKADYPWLDAPETAVYRHKESRKWFGLVMTIPVSKLGLEGNLNIDVINLKCDPLLTGSLHKENGIFPAYHMNRAHWLSLALDGSVDNHTIEWLLDLSYDLTKPKMPRKKGASCGDK